MPAAAIEAGGAKEVLPRGNIAKRVLELVKT
jgi:chemotaxis response regulator CheB